MGRLSKKIEENKPIPKVYFCKNCSTEINHEEHRQNREFCQGCLKDVYKEFGEDNNGTY